VSVPGKDVVIEVLVTPECPHAGAAVELVRDVAARIAPEVEAQISTVRTPAEAKERSFPGSPTIRVNGVDLEGADPGPAAFACRRYEDGSGVPPRWLVEARILQALGPKHVLFLCVANSARSQMAEGLGRHLAPADVRISSAGSEPSRVRPQAVAALADVGIDASAQRSKSFDEFMAGGSEFDASAPVDCVITLCAEENCPVWLGDARRVHWPLPDPAAATGSEEEVLDSFRIVRDEIRSRLEVLFGA
jgi:arsenate reductase